MPMTFGELTRGCTPAEIDALAWHLAAIRARATYEALRPPLVWCEICRFAPCRCAQRNRPTKDQQP